MKVKYIFMLAASVLLATGCREKKAGRFAALPFPDMMPPEMLEDAQDRVEYMALHWWDRFADSERMYPCDSVLVNGVRRSDVEQKFANWTRVLGLSRRHVATEAVGRLYHRMALCEAKDTSSIFFEQMTEIVEKYLFDPNSPMRDEDLYGVYAGCLAKSPYVSDSMKPAYEYDVRACSLNQVGTIASDFRFSDKNGRIRTLHGIKAEMTLVFFSNPGCTACKEIMDVLCNEPVISGMVADGTLAVLNIYIDEDIESWRSYMPVYPDSWYNGFDPDYVIRGEALYNIRAIPSLYLLDRDKRVILKDAPEGRLFEWLKTFSISERSGAGDGTEPA